MASCDLPEAVAPMITISGRTTAITAPTAKNAGTLRKTSENAFLEVPNQQSLTTTPGEGESGTTFVHSLPRKVIQCKPEEVSSWHFQHEFNVANWPIRWRRRSAS